MRATILDLIRSFSFFMLIIAAGCSSTGSFFISTPVTVSTDSIVFECRTLFEQLLAHIHDAGVRDSQTVRIPGFPYLRADRFLASFKDETLQEDAFTSWLDRLQELGSLGFAAELSNLDAETRLMLPDKSAINGCGKQLRQHDFEQDPDIAYLSRRSLIRDISIPDEYQTWKRLAGLYWLTAWPVKLSTEKLHREIQHTYNSPFNQLKPIQYHPPETVVSITSEKIKAILNQSYRENPLGIPVLDPGDRDLLFSYYAPVLVVDSRSDADRIGDPRWQKGNPLPVIDIRTAVIFQHLSYTRFQRRVLLQLNYIFWFPARPKLSSWDYLGGNIDGLTWRVTLAEDGSVIAYDSIHNCGCYHLFFPTSLTCIKEQTAIFQEPALSPQSVTQISNQTDRIHLYIAHTSHFIERVRIESGANARDNVTYTWKQYDSLRSLLKADGSRQSLFQENGIVAGTQRSERYFLWPMGIPAPGAMRQWGHHATAFYGRRHFDDPDLIGQNFRLKDGVECGQKQ